MKVPKTLEDAERLYPGFVDHVVGVMRAGIEKMGEGGERPQERLPDFPPFLFTPMEAMSSPLTHDAYMRAFGLTVVALLLGLEDRSFKHWERWANWYSTMIEKHPVDHQAQLWFHACMTASEKYCKRNSIGGKIRRFFGAG